MTRGKLTFEPWGVLPDLEFSEVHARLPAASMQHDLHIRVVADTQWDLLGLPSGVGACYGAAGPDRPIGTIFFPWRNIASARTMLVHEMGHHAQRALTPERLVAWDMLFARLQSPKNKKGKVIVNAKKLRLLERLLRMFSGYAAKNSREGFAEVFAHVYDPANGVKQPAEAVEFVTRTFSDA